MEEKNNESSVRIQTSILNGVEKKALIFGLTGNLDG